MRAICVDDEIIALGAARLLLEKMPEIEAVECFNTARGALEWLEKNAADVAFLDISMREMDGLSLAQHVKELCPRCAVIFVTGYTEYAIDAFKVRASGYIVKPLTQKDVQAELDNLRNASQLLEPPAPQHRVRVQCFGNFEAFGDGEPFKFRYSKTKEFFAYLIHRKGAYCTGGEICAVLWEDRPNSASIKSQLRNLIWDLSTALEGVGSEDALIRHRGEYCVLPDKLDCDYFDWTKGLPHAAHFYTGEYMTQYSWAEITTGRLLAEK